MAHKVISEIYTEHDYKSNSKPLINKTNIVSIFKFTYPPPRPQLDADGDLIVSRKTNNQSGTIEIEHQTSTVLDLVGLQVWRGALLLADWLMHYGPNFDSQKYILELGSGVGLTSIMAAMYAPVYCTDVDKGGIFNLIKGNFRRNKQLMNYPAKVLELDFNKNSLPQEIEEILPNTPIVLAADVIYDDEITEAFIHTLELLSAKPPRRSIYIALEKRYVFTIADCDSVAPCYEHFVKCLKNLDNVQKVELPLDFPQYFEYDRVKELVLWKITSNYD